MGGANYVCSDKTGTLTQNKMTLTKIWNKEMKVVDVYSDEIDLSKTIPNKGIVEMLVRGITCNSNAQLHATDPEKHKGSKTEIAFLEFSRKCGFNTDEYRDKFLGDDFIRFPFSSKRKRMGSIVKGSENDSGLRLHIKGASEIILNGCDKIHYWDSNSVEPLTPEVKA